MINIGIVGSRKWNNINRIEYCIDLSIKKFGEVCIVSGGAWGADLIGKELALLKGLEYKEFNPAHTNHNQYSVKPKDWFNQPYNPANFFERNTFIAEESDYLFAFIPEGITANGTMNTVMKIKKLKKPYTIIN